MKHVVLYHANCADGFGAAFAAWKKFGFDPGVAYRAVHYNKDRDWVDFLVDQLGVGRDTAVYVLDFSFDRATTEWLMEHTGKFVWLDHHKGSFEMWNGSYERGDVYESKGGLCDTYTLLDDNKSGAVLAWEYFHPGTEVPLMIRHIDDRDRWQFKIEGTREFNAALRSMEPWSFEDWPIIMADLEAGDEAWYEQGTAIIRAHDQHVQSIAWGAKMCRLSFMVKYETATVGEFRDGLIVNCPPAFASDVGHKLATDCGTYGLMWHTVDGVEARCSLRSNGEYDVSAIAKAFGGGGHLTASGFAVPLQDLLEWYKG